MMYLILGTVFGFASLASFATHYTMSGKALITPEEAKKLLKDAIIIDVRTERERSMLGYHPDSIHLPTSKMTSEHVNRIIGDPGQTIIVYCNSGQRARLATKKLHDLGFKNAKYIAGTYHSLLPERI